MAYIRDSHNRSLPTTSPKRGAAGHVRPARATREAIEVNLSSPAQTIESVVSELNEGRGFTLFTVNLDHLVKFLENPAFRVAYQRAEFVSADGWPVVWALKSMRRDLERTTGADLVAPLCRRLSQIGVPVYFVGPQAWVQAKSIERLRYENPDLQVTGAESPLVLDPLDPQLLAEMSQRINRAGARICFVSLGAPKQELLADALRELCPGVGFICTGAALDFIAGALVRAPLVVQRAGLEWLWRLGGQPRRLTVRYLKCLFVLFFLAIRQIPVTATPSRAS